MSKFDIRPTSTVNTSNQRKIKMSLIDENPLNEKTYDMNDPEIKALAQDIASIGLLQPILVMRNPKLSDRYVILAGHKRFRAQQLNKADEIEVIVRPVPEDANYKLEMLKAELSIYSSNIFAREKSPLVRAREAARFKELIKEMRSIDPDSYKGNTDEIVAKVLGVGASYVRALVRVNSAPNDVKELLNEQKITLRQAMEITSMDDEIAEEVKQKINSTSSKAEKNDVIKRGVAKSKKNKDTSNTTPTSTKNDISDSSSTITEIPVKVPPKVDANTLNLVVSIEDDFKIVKDLIQQGKTIDIKTLIDVESLLHKILNDE